MRSRIVAIPCVLTIAGASAGGSSFEVTGATYLGCKLKGKRASTAAPSIHSCGVQ
ncbi:MAG TPA: hypothetical protein VEC57_20735 [Candidatus Limnocylindrales bacterium]|nr:hypothetical protein [Candidatus Limnocylindrales bacterium]